MFFVVLTEQGWLIYYYYYYYYYYYCIISFVFRSVVFIPTRNRPLGSSVSTQENEE